MPALPYSGTLRLFMYAPQSRGALFTVQIVLLWQDRHSGQGHTPSLAAAGHQAGSRTIPFNPLVCDTLLLFGFETQIATPTAERAYTRSPIKLRTVGNPRLLRETLLRTRISTLGQYIHVMDGGAELYGNGHENKHSEYMRGTR